MSIDWTQDPRILFAVIAASSDGDNTLVAAVSGRKIRVLSYFLASAQAGIRIFTNGASGAELGRANVAAAGNASYEGPVPAFETGENVALILVNEAGDDTQGHLTYVLTGD